MSKIVYNEYINPINTDIKNGLFIPSKKSYEYIKTERYNSELCMLFYRRDYSEYYIKEFNYYDKIAKLQLRYLQRYYPEVMI